MFMKKDDMGSVSKDELACIYAALILVDDDVPVTSEKIATLLNAADVNVESIWPSLYAKALAGINIKQFILGKCSLVLHQLTRHMSSSLCRFRK